MNAYVIAREKSYYYKHLCVRKDLLWKNNGEWTLWLAPNPVKVKPFGWTEGIAVKIVAETGDTYVVRPVNCGREYRLVVPKNEIIVDDSKQPVILNICRTRTSSLATPVRWHLTV